jgi:hypothetical protein
MGAALTSACVDSRSPESEVIPGNSPSAQLLKLINNKEQNKTVLQNDFFILSLSFLIIELFFW